MGGCNDMAKLTELNDCHDPETGEFCSAKSAYVQSVVDSLNRAGKATHEREMHRAATLDVRPEGSTVRTGRTTWTKQTIAGDIFWMPDRKTKTPLSSRQMALELGSRLQEYNHNHDPKNGRFSSGPGSIVGITSARREGDPLHRSNADVAKSMEQFADDLRHLPGVTRVNVKPAVGQWDGGSEFSWAVSYDGNGNARRLLAKYGNDWNQDAVLLLKRTPGAKDQSVWEMEFASVPKAVREAAAAELSKHIGGWTWFKRDGRTVLRSVAVPEWGGENRAHASAIKAVADVLRRSGVTPLRGQRVRGYRTELLGKGYTEYADVLSGRA